MVATCAELFVVRGMGGSIVDWHRLFRQIYDNLKPGEYDNGYYRLLSFEAVGD